MILMNWLPVGAPAGRGGTFKVWETAWPVVTSKPASTRVSLTFKQLCPVRYECAKLILAIPRPRCFRELKVPATPLAGTA
jgi:hypothetical protein